MLIVLFCLAFSRNRLLAQNSLAATQEEEYESLLHKGRDAEAAGALSQAAISFDQAMKLRPQAPEAFYEAGVLEGRLSDFRKTEALMRDCLQRAPDFAKAHYLLGVSLVADASSKLAWPEAIDEFRTASRLQHPYPEAIARLGQGLLAVGKADEAVSVLEAAHAALPKSVPLTYQLGEAYSATGQSAAALDVFRQAVSIDPHADDAVTSLAKALLTEGQPGAAIAPLAELLRSNPDLQSPHYLLARALRAVGQPEKASVETAISASLMQRGPDAVAATQLNNEAMHLASQGKLQDAETMLRHAIASRPDYGVAHYNLGLILADQRKYDEASRQLQQAISLLPNSPKPIFDLGRVELIVGNRAEAQRYFEIADGLASNDPRTQAAVRSAMQSMQPAQSSPPSAIDVPQQWADTVSAHETLAKLMLAADDPIGAAGQLLRALSLAPANLQVRALLADAYAKAGKPQASAIETQKLQYAALAHAGPSPQQKTRSSSK